MQRVQWWAAQLVSGNQLVLPARSLMLHMKLLVASHFIRRASRHRSWRCTGLLPLARA